MEKQDLKNTNAFPEQGVNWVMGQKEIIYSSGMTLLDYFAAQAMLHHKPTTYVGEKETEKSFSDAASNSYKYAYAMLKEREKYISL